MKRKCVILVFILVAFVYKSSGQTHSDSVYTDLVLFKIGNNLISLDTAIEKKDFWKSFLTEEKSFVRKVCSNCDHVFIYIAKIEVKDSANYIFKILTRPLQSGNKNANGYCSYKIKIGINPISKKREIRNASLMGREI